MEAWYDDLTRWAWQTESGIDAVRRRIGDRLGRRDPIHIVPYLGYGSRDRLRVHGRVLQDDGAIGGGTGLWSSLRDMLLRFESDEVPGARLVLTAGGAQAETISDEEGFFDTWIELAEPLPADRTAVAAEVRLAVAPGSPPVTATAEVMVPSAAAELGVISDLDDTVLHTDATSLFKMARNVFLSDARTRMPLPGVATFYRALAGGVPGAARNPVFYVSSSPWNLYDLLVEFLALNDIPRGPLFLRDWGLSERELFPRDHHSHKLDAIRGLLDLYPELPFVLIGDSGQQDPEIYRRVVEEHPGRIAAIYIRNVSLADVERPEAIRALAAELAVDRRSELLLVDTTLEAAQHAAARGWIDADTLTAVADEVVHDLAPPEVPELDLVKEADRSGGDPDEVDARSLAAAAGAEAAAEPAAKRTTL